MSDKDYSQYKLNAQFPKINKKLLFKASLPKIADNLIDPPLTLDLREWISPIKDQGSIGDCVGMATSAIAEYKAYKFCKYRNPLSPWFIYITGGATSADSGLPLEAGPKTLITFGASPEIIFPTPKIVTQPDRSLIQVNAFKQALNFRINSYAALSSANEMKIALTNYGPCIIGVMVYNFGAEPWNQECGTSQGGHALAVVGYDENNFIIRNSWGESWADKGYTKLPFKDYSKYVVQAFTSTDLTNIYTVKPEHKINMESIVIFSLIGVFILFLFIYYVFYKGLYKLPIFNSTFHYSRYVSEILFFILLIISTMLMYNLNGLNNVFIVNIIIISMYVITTLTNLYIDKQMKFII
jgi:hypothetical protein